MSQDRQPDPHARVQPAQPLSSTGLQLERAAKPSPAVHDGFVMRDAIGEESLVRRPWLLGLVISLLAAVIFTLGVTVGYGLVKTGVQAAANETPAVALPNTQATDRASGPDIALLEEAFDLLYRDYYGELPPTDAATYAAIRGVVDLLEDPNTSFLTPSEADFFRSNLEGSFEGIGARVAWDDEMDTLVITEPFENQPAWNAGLRRHDFVLAVDGESLTGLGLTDAVARDSRPQRHRGDAFGPARRRRKLRCSHHARCRRRPHDHDG